MPQYYVAFQRYLRLCIQTMILMGGKVICYERSLKQLNYSIMPMPRVWNIGIILIRVSDSNPPNQCRLDQSSFFSLLSLPVSRTSEVFDKHYSLHLTYLMAQALLTVFLEKPNKSLSLHFSKMSKYITALMVARMDMRCGRQLKRSLGNSITFVT